MSSIFSRAQLADLGGGPNGGDARGNIFNALQYKHDARSLIENAEGGSGNDTLYGNAAANTLRGGAGNDKLCGLAGKDTLVGGKGADVFIFNYRLAFAPPAPATGSWPATARQPSRGRAAGRRPDRPPPPRRRHSRAPAHQDFVFGTVQGARPPLARPRQGGVTYVNGNADSDAAIEFQLAIHDGAVRASAYSAHDFIL